MNDFFNLFYKICKKVITLCCLKFIMAMIKIIDVSWKTSYVNNSTHIVQGGLPMYVATRALYSMKPPTVFVPPCIKDDVEKLFDIHRSMTHDELKVDLIPLDIGLYFFLQFQYSTIKFFVFLFIFFPLMRFHIR